MSKTIFKLLIVGFIIAFISEGALNLPLAARIMADKSARIILIFITPEDD